MDTIYEFTWIDRNGKRRVTTVGITERNDQWEYLAILQSAGTVWDVDYTVEGKDI